MTKKVNDLMDTEFSRMDDDEVLTYIRKIRQSRITPKATSKVAKKRKVASAKNVDKTKNLIDKLSDEEKQQILKDLGDY